jgi:hypothetical protein
MQKEGFGLKPVQSPSPAHASPATWQANSVEKQPGCALKEAQSKPGSQSSLVTQLELTQRPTGSPQKQS